MDEPLVDREGARALSHVLWIGGATGTGVTAIAQILFEQIASKVEQR